MDYDQFARSFPAKQRTYHYNYNGTIVHKDDPNYTELDPAAPEPLPAGVHLPSPFIPMDERESLGLGHGAPTLDQSLDLDDSLRQTMDRDELSLGL